MNRPPADAGAGAVPHSSSPGGRPADPDASPCVDCGHVWFAGERRHEHVPAPPPPGFRTGGDRVEVVCALCRRQRDRRAAGE